MRAGSARWLIVAIGLCVVLGVLVACSRGDFGLRATSRAITIPRGESDAVSIVVTRTGGFDGEITFALDGAPSGLTARFNPVKTDAACAETALTLTVAEGLDTRRYSLKVLAISGNRRKEVDLVLTVQEEPRFSLEVAPTRLTVVDKGTTELEVGLVATPTFTDCVTLTLPGAPPGFVASFNPASIRPGERTTMTLKVGENIELGTHVLTLHGEGGDLERLERLPVLVLPRERTVTYPYEAVEGLPEWEKTEQVRDWIVYAFLAAGEVPADCIAVSVHSQPPLRQPALSEVYSWQYGIGRWVWVDDDPADGSVGDLYAFLPVGADQRLLGGFADDFRRTTGEVPAFVHHVAYEIDEQEQIAGFAFRETFVGEAFFGDDGPFGYHEASIRTREDLEEFLAETDDLVHVTVEEGTLKLGGRDLPNRSPVVSIEDLAVVYQAYQEADVRTQLAALGKALRGEYYLMTFTHASALANALYGYFAKGDSFSRLEAEALLERYGMDPARVVTLYREHVTGGSIGFSLDPEGAMDFSDLSSGLSELQLVSTDVDPWEWQEVLFEAEQWQLLPLHRIMQELLDKGTEDALKVYNEISSLLARYACQCARYDGDIQGSSVGMTLFYCDLLAKLWVFDYENSTPRTIGMVPDLELPIASVYWQELSEIKEGRLWFGVNWAMVGDAGTCLSFAPVATRVFCAASDPNRPGEEVKPREDWRVWFQWWETHWPEIMEYEPEYYRLNEISKFSTLVAWLQEIGQISTLRFLEGVPVTRTHEFKTWFEKNCDRLALKAWLPFTGVSASGTECLSWVCSEWRSAFGVTRCLSGGVSLPQRQDLVNVHKVVEYAAAVQRILHEGGSFTAQNDTTYRFSVLTDARGSCEVIPGSGVRFRGVLTETPGIYRLNSEWTWSEDNALIWSHSVALSDGRSVDEMSLSFTQEEQRCITISLQPSTLMRAQQMVEKLAQSDQPFGETLVQLDGVERVQEIFDGTFLVHHRAAGWLRIGAGNLVGDASLRAGAMDREYIVSLSLLSEMEAYCWELLSENPDDPNALVDKLTRLDWEALLGDVVTPCLQSAGVEYTVVWSNDRPQIRVLLAEGEPIVLQVPNNPVHRVLVWSALSETKNPIIWVAAGSTVEHARAAWESGYLPLDRPTTVYLSAGTDVSDSVRETWAANTEKLQAYADRHDMALRFVDLGTYTADQASETIRRAVEEGTQNVLVFAHRLDYVSLDTGSGGRLDMDWLGTVSPPFTDRVVALVGCNSLLFGLNDLLISNGVVDFSLTTGRTLTAWELFSQLAELAAQMRDRLEAGKDSLPLSDLLEILRRFNGIALECSRTNSS